MTNSPSDDRAAEELRDDVPEAAEAQARDEMPENGAAPEADVEALQQELEQVRAQHQRALADYRNLQRRSDQDRADHARFTLIALLHNFLPVFDDLNRALDNVDPQLADHAWVEGVRLVRQKFWSVLESAGMEEIPALGERFDPEVHEAVGYAPGAEGQVVALVQAGYRLQDRTVRPAMVLVGSGEEPQSEAEPA